MPIDFPALVLSRTGTGLATIRCLSAAGMEVHAAIFSRREAVNYTRLATKCALDHNMRDNDQLIRWIIEYARRLGCRPLLFPTGDAEALLIAEYRDALMPYCRIWNNSRADLLNIIGKEQLYRHAANAGIAIVPSLYRPAWSELEAWSHSHPGPYLIKPDYEGSPRNTLGKKNLSFDDRTALLQWAQHADLSELIIQRRLRGGDGNIFDCYGLCDANGRVVTLATHRRWRQHLPDVGATCFGEIPANAPDVEALTIERTQRLLGTLKYHGIFGIEWLRDDSSGEVYLIDFNARPFSTISHLADCGLNLPHLAALELAGDDLSHIPLTPSLQHKFWVDFPRDIETYTLKRDAGELTLLRWLRSLLNCRSFAYWDPRDPGPALYQAFQLLRRLHNRGWRAAVALAQFMAIDF